MLVTMSLGGLVTLAVNEYLDTCYSPVMSAGAPYGMCVRPQTGAHY